MAVISGAGFRPAEVVTIHVEHSNGFNEGAGHVPFAASADADGRVVAIWHVDADDSLGSIFRLTARGADSGLTATSTFTDVLISFIDDQGPDDQPGQKDLTAMSSNPGGSAVAITWNWDDTDFGALGGNTGDACALVDTNQDGKANYSFCVVADGNPANQVSNRLYTCGDTRSDRCASPTVVPTFTSTSTASVVANSDPFAGHPSHSAGNDCDNDVNCLTADTVANVTLQLSDVGGAVARLINVCSYPSSEPNSDPSDCVVHPDSGFLTITKVDSQTGDTTPFTFNLGAGQTSQSGISSWTINGSGSQSLISVAPGTAYDLTEAIPTGWKLTDVSCAIQTASPTATGTPDSTPVSGPISKGVQDFTIQSGLETICTFTDAKLQGSIKIVKNTVGGIDGQQLHVRLHAGRVWVGCFDLTTTGANDSDESTTFGSVVVGGTYSVSETSTPAGWTLSDSACAIDGSPAGTPAGITVQDNKTTICTFTNTENQNLTRGKIKIAKITNPASDTTTAFTFTRDYGSASFSLTGGQEDASGSLVPTTYSVAESVPPSGWTLSNVSCSVARTTGDAEPTTSVATVTNASVSIELGGGDTVTCTYTNTKAGTLRVQKTTLPAGDTTSFTIAASGSGTITGGGAGSVTDATDKVYEVTPGTYSVAETVPTGWDKTGDTCQSVVVAAGAEATCVLTNTKRGRLTVQKTTVPAGDATSFTIAASGNGTITGGGAGSVTDATDKVYEVTPGTYSIAETVPAGWDKTGDTCQAVVVAAGADVTCLLTNTRRGTLKVQKTTLPAGDTTNFTIAASGSGTITGGGAGSVTDATDKVYEVTPGTYSVAETVPAGWNKTGDTCQSVVVSAGVESTCLLTNTKVGTLRVQKTTLPAGNTTASRSVRAAAARSRVAARAA